MLYFLTRRRSASTKTDLAGMTLAALVDHVPAGARAYAVASDRDQDRLLVGPLAGFETRTPGLTGSLTVDCYTASIPTGARLEVIPAG